MSDEDVSLLFGNAGAVVMPPERSVDTDTEVDFALAEAVLEARDGTTPTASDGAVPRGVEDGE